MQKDTIALLTKYNKAANEAMDGFIKTLDGAEWEKNLGGYFSSVRGLCSHLYVCDFNWLKRYSRLRDFALFKDPFFGRDPYPFKEVLFADKAEYLAKRPELDEKWIAFAGEVTDGDLAASLKYADSSGRQYDRNFGGLILHCLNHDTHHRGMISFCLEMLGKDNDFNSLARVL
jgi:uncharacterized damage-inducible protein DinB